MASAASPDGLLPARIAPRKHMNERPILGCGEVALTSGLGSRLLLRGRAAAAPVCRELLLRQQR